MGYMYDHILHLSQEAYDSAARLRKIFNEAGLQVDEAPENQGKLHFDVTNPKSGNKIGLDLFTAEALADGYHFTGRVVVLRDEAMPYWQTIQNLPYKTGSSADLNISMQGDTRDDTESYARSIVAKLKTPAPKS